jgi:hypothetical protein
MENKLNYFFILLGYCFALNLFLRRLARQNHCCRDAAKQIVNLMFLQKKPPEGGFWIIDLDFTASA